MKAIINYALLMLVGLTGIFALSSCRDDSLYVAGQPYDGEVSLDLDFEFEAMGDALETRAVDGNLDFGIDKLTIFFYKTSESENEAPAYVRQYSKSEFKVYKLEQRPETHCEENTYHGKVLIDGIQGDSYRIYGVANVDFAGAGYDDLNTVTEKQLREIRIVWPESVAGRPSGKSPGAYGVPDAMFGYFTLEGVTDHTLKKYRNVVHHNTTNSLYDNTTEANDQQKKGSGAGAVNRAVPVTLDREHLEMQAWLKRVVSKLSIGYDGSALNHNVEIFIKSVSIMDAPASCFLGHDNSAGDFNDVDGDPVVLLDNETYSQDPRFYLEYSSEPGATGQMISRDKPGFPREGLADDVRTIKDGTWNKEWYDKIHGSWTNPDPQYNNRPTSLYFLENLQGCATEQESPKLQRKQKEDEGYEKDGRLYGTYIEVKAYYKNTNFGEESEGNIIYRFMLGKDVVKDFNAERNHHYKLTLSFLGDANNPDWHIEIEEPELPYFRIPNEEEWKQSGVWHAYNDEGEPVAEMAREIIYVGEGRNDRKYYQVVTVYPVLKHTDETGRLIRYETDLRHGKIAQVLKTDNGDLNDFKAGGDIAMYLRTQPSVDNIPSMAGYSYGGRMAIKSLTNGGEENYYFVNILSDDYSIKMKGKVWEKPTNTVHYDYLEEEEEYDNKKYYDLKLGDRLNYEWRIRPYRVSDYDNNSYSVVKIAGAYWMRENLRCKHWENGQEVHPWGPSKRTGSWHGKTSQGSSSSSYDYDFGGIEGETFCVEFYERFPMYKEVKGEVVYNYLAVCGPRADGFDQPLDYFYNDEPSWVDAIFYDHPDDEYAYEVFYPGWIAAKYRSVSSEQFWDTSDLYELNTDYDSDHTLAPRGWHIPMDLGYRMENYGGVDGDVSYLEQYFENTWERAFGDNSAFGAWPKSQNSKLTQTNLSDLSLMPIPLNWESGDYTVTFDVTDKGLVNNSTKGVVVPFWNNILNLREDYLYPLPPFVQYYNDAKDNVAFTTTTGPTISMQYLYDVTSSYLPVRCVRDAYDYSVAPIADRQTDPTP